LLVLEVKVERVGLLLGFMVAHLLAIILLSPQVFSVKE
jgi:hypothetical protein